jgi:hypothetical protein
LVGGWWKEIVARVLKGNSALAYRDAHDVLCWSQARRIGLSASPARRAVAKFIAMMMANTGIQDP